MRPLRVSGAEKVAAGLTTAAEVLCVTASTPLAVDDGGPAPV